MSGFVNLIETLNAFYLFNNVKDFNIYESSYLVCNC